MEATYITIDEFIKLHGQFPVIDVRSPGEYEQAHIPGAWSVPLFSNEERAVVGTIYKQKNREAAIKKGLEYYGPKMNSILLEVERILSRKKKKTAIVHCWRGGMRSAAVAWLLSLYGFEIYLLEGGYKKFRNWALAQFENPHNLRILGGFTGSGKTEILRELQNQSQPVLDLEGLAKHKGSAFGNLDQHAQPTTEQFENDMAIRLFELGEKFGKQPIWVEGESNRIGLVNIPHKFFDQMKISERINIEIPFEKRLDFILKGYGDAEKEALKEATKRIKKRLGGLRMQQAVNFIENGDLRNAFGILLEYYDKAYEKSRKQFEGSLQVIALEDTNAEENAGIILKTLKNPA